MLKYHINYAYINNPEIFNETYLMQLGRLYSQSGHVVDTHAHLDWYELTIVTSGKGRVITNGEASDVSEGDIYLSYPGDFHSITSSEESPLNYDFFAFNTKNPEIKSELSRITSLFSYNNRIFRDVRINSAVSAAIMEFSSDGKYRNKILSSIFEQIIYYLLGNFDTVPSSKKSKHISSYDELCFQIMNYIDTHLYSIDNLSSLSEAFAYNYSYLSDIFKKNTGNTIKNYYQKRRLEAAKLLLSERKMKIISISEMLNYSSLYSFSNAFKNQYGISPKHYMELHNQS